MKERDLLEGILRELGDSFPQLHRVLVEERDAVLAHNIWRASLQLTQRLPPTVITSGSSASRAASAMAAAPAEASVATSSNTTGLLETPHQSATSPASLSAASSVGNLGAQQPHAHFSACSLTAHQHDASGGAPSDTDNNAVAGADEPAAGRATLPAAPKQQNQFRISVGSQPYFLTDEKHANAAHNEQPEQMVAGATWSTQAAEHVDDERSRDTSSGGTRGCCSRGPDVDSAEGSVQQKGPEEPCACEIHRHEEEQLSEAESEVADDVEEVEIGGDNEGTADDTSRHLVTEKRTGSAEERAPVLVAVVGMGHVSGIVTHWDRMPYSIVDYMKYSPLPALFFILNCNRIVGSLALVIISPTFAVLFLRAVGEFKLIPNRL